MVTTASRKEADDNDKLMDVGMHANGEVCWFVIKTYHNGEQRGGRWGGGGGVGGWGGALHCLSPGVPFWV